MEFVRNKCKTCACENVCSLKDDVDAFRTDLMKLEWWGGQKYTERLKTMTVKIECNNYIDKTKMHSEEVGD